MPSLLDPARDAVARPILACNRCVARTGNAGPHRTPQLHFRVEHQRTFFCNAALRKLLLDRVIIHHLLHQLAEGQRVKCAGRLHPGLEDALAIGQRNAARCRGRTGSAPPPHPPKGSKYRRQLSLESRNRHHPDWPKPLMRNCRSMRPRMTARLFPPLTTNPGSAVRKLRSMIVRGICEVA